jgi:hypothetical protein
MDPRFADRMSDLAQLTDDVLDQRWATLVSVADEADRHQQARIVLLACGAELERTQDSWLWEPFREHEKTIPVDDGGELFTRIAECATRHMIEENRWQLPAMCVRLADMAGMSPFHQDLVDAAHRLLLDSPLVPPSGNPPAAFWTTKISKALDERPNEPVVLQEQLVAVAAGAQRATSALATQIADVAKFAGEVSHRFNLEQQLIQWLIHGSRTDGTPWTELDASTVAVDAAVELSQFVFDSPQPRHELALAQALAVAGKTTTVSQGVVDDLEASLSVPDDTAIAALVPLTVAIGSGMPLPEAAPTDLAVRMLWETTTLRTWNS